MKAIRHQISTMIMGAVPGMSITLSVFAESPDPGMQLEQGRTALVITDPQKNVLRKI